MYFLNLWCPSEVSPRYCMYNPWWQIAVGLLEGAGFEPVSTAFSGTVHILFLLMLSLLSSLLLLFCRCWILLLLLLLLHVRLLLIFSNVLLFIFQVLLLPLQCCCRCCYRCLYEWSRKKWCGTHLLTGLTEVALEMEVRRGRPDHSAHGLHLSLHTDWPRTRCWPGKRHFVLHSSKFKGWLVISYFFTVQSPVLLTVAQICSVLDQSTTRRQ